MGVTGTMGIKGYERENTVEYRKVYRNIETSLWEPPEEGILLAVSGGWEFRGSRVLVN